MRHLKSGRRLGRTSSHRKAMLRNMVTSLLEHGYVHTTDEKAKELRPVIDGMITLGKKNTLHARRLAARTIRSRAVLTKLFDEVAPGFTERHGGYTRIIKLGKRRVGDAAEYCVIQFVGAEEGPEIGGNISNRRRIADKRTAYAAKVRKGFAKKEAEPAEA